MRRLWAYCLRRLSQPRPPPEAAPASDPAWSNYVSTSSQASQEFRWLGAGTSEMTINIQVPAEGTSSSSSIGPRSQIGSPQYVPVPPQARQPQATANAASEANNFGTVTGPYIPPEEQQERPPQAQASANEAAQARNHGDVVGPIQAPALWQSVCVS